MQIYRYPLLDSWQKIARRPWMDYSAKTEIVREVMQNIRDNGDTALRECTKKFDHVDIEDLVVSSEEIKVSASQLSKSLKEAITVAAKNIDTFHVAQRTPTRIVETMPGVKCWQKTVAIDKVGLYIPGGSAPLFSTVLMLGLPALIAGCREVILCSPPDSNGKVHPAILYAAELCHITKIFKVGGIQAIGAMAYGTESVPRVDKIFGPGNSWVMAAKQFVSMSDCAIDMPAGPSEVAVMADGSANVEFIAADLLSQAEHGPDSQVILITTEDDLIKSVIEAIERQIKDLPRSATAMKALENSRAILVKDEEEMLEFINLYAPEHLIIATRSAHKLTERVINAGSVFIGNYTPESAGDYASGTNHTLPTNGWTRSFSGINLDSFCKKITFQEITFEGIQKLGPIIEEMAEAEQLFAHKNAATLRMKVGKSEK
jgi:histidinol dehydrogenase